MRRDGRLDIRGDTNGFIRAETSIDDNLLGPVTQEVTDPPVYADFITIKKANFDLKLIFLILAPQAR